MAEIRLTIDGQALGARPGETILEVARRAGLGERVPTLCHHDGSAPQGSCRLCLVAVADTERPLAACATPVRDGMRIDTATPEIESLRRELLTLIRDAHPLAGTPQRSGGGRAADEFAQLLKRYGVAAETDRVQPHPAAPAQHHPYLRFDPGLCVTCRRCVQVCEDLQGQFVYAMGGRGAGTHLLFGSDEQFRDSPCVSCGACVDACPTGALGDRDRMGPRPVASKPPTRSVCGYCGVGCNVEIYSDGSTVSYIDGARDAVVNQGHLCSKGRFAHGWARSPERLTAPLLREGEHWREISWSDALSWAATRLRDIAARHGPEALGVLTSARSTNEAAYLFQKVFRALFGTNNVDCCARVCHASTALALSMATGTGAASASYADIEKAQVIVLAGANPTEAHPVLGARIKQAARRGAQLLVIDPRVTELCDYAVMHLQIEPGTNVPLFNALAKVLLDENLIDWPYLAARTENLEALQELCARLSLADAAATAGVTVSQVEAAARLIGGRGPVLFVTGLGLSELTQGTDSVLTLNNLAMLTGSIGRPGGGMLPLRGQNNVQGNADMGSAPGLVTGYQPVSDPAVRERVRAVWGVAPPEKPGLTIPEMFEAARAGQLRALWIQGEDVLQSDPNEALVRQALESVELLVVQELFLSETARYAHLVLPAAGVLEQDGTFTNGERRIQRVRRAVAPPGAARPDWEVARDLAQLLGASWRYEHPGEVMDEIARVAPKLFGGVSYERLGGQGLQWPCPEPSHPGTATVHAERFMRGRGRFFALEHVQSIERRNPALPYLLITGRVLHQYNVGSMTRRTPNIELTGSDCLVMHPADAAREGLRDGDATRVSSRHGSIVVAVRTSEEVRPGTLFLTFHFPQTHANALTSGLVDPQSKCPEYKLTAVSVKPVAGVAAVAANR